MVLYQCADKGEISHDEAQKLVRSILTAGVDTTVNGIGASVYCMARYPDQWQKLRANPKLARAAFEEAVDLIAGADVFRTTTKATEARRSSLEADRKILLFLGAANRDPRSGNIPIRTISSAPPMVMSGSAPVSHVRGSSSWRGSKAESCSRHWRSVSSNRDLREPTASLQ